MPSKGWVWPCYDVRCPVEIKGRTEDEMIELAADHCQANDIPIGSQFREQVIERMCDWYAERHGIHICTEMRRVVAVRETPITLQQVLVGTKTIIDWKVMSGGAVVDVDTANHRAGVCLDCRQHVTGTGCEGCKGGVLRDLVAKFLGGRATGKTANLLVCAVCGCALKVKVWLPLDVIHRHVPDSWNAMFPPECWAKKP